MIHCNSRVNEKKSIPNLRISHNDSINPDLIKYWMLKEREMQA